MTKLKEWERLVQEVQIGIQYLRNRLTGKCEPVSGISVLSCVVLGEVVMLSDLLSPFVCSA